jgi:hypothetical protein
LLALAKLKVQLLEAKLLFVWDMKETQLRRVDARRLVKPHNSDANAFPDL